MRLRFKDSEILEGLMPADLTQTTPEGFLVNPPDQRSNTQRIFVPRTALESLTVLAVIGATRRQRRGGAGSAASPHVRGVGGVAKPDYSQRRIALMSSLAMGRVADQIPADATRARKTSKPADTAKPTGFAPSTRLSRKRPVN